MEVPPSLRVAVCVLLMCTAGSAAGLTSDTDGTSHQDPIVRDCSDLPAGSASGVYPIMQDLTLTSAYCDLDDGEGWTVFQRRADILPRQNFYQDWEAYKWGLGSFDGEFWWGLHPLWQLTSQSDRTYELRVDLKDWDEQTAYATYQDFTIASEADGFGIGFTDYAGDAGDSLSYHVGMKFSTVDRDNDVWSGNCSSTREGAWWYRHCADANLNGKYDPRSTEDTAVFWYAWRGIYSLQATTMKIRPTVKP